MSLVFGVAGPHVVGDEVDGEVIVINLDNGSYFSFRDVASVLWQLFLDRPVSLDEMVSHLAARYRGDPGAMRIAVDAFVRSVEAEGLIASSDASSPAEAAGAPAGPTSDLPEFEVPTFEKHTEMEEFLLVDPIHEVDVSQWPVVTKRDEGDT